jgi:hypothetical protein
MDAPGVPYSYHATPQSQDPRSPNYTSITYTDGSACLSESFQTETPDSPRTLERHWEKNLASTGTSHLLRMLRSWTRELLPMHSPLTALTLTAYLLSRTTTRLSMLTDRLTHAY